MAFLLLYYALWAGALVAVILLLVCLRQTAAAGTGSGLAAFRRHLPAFAATVAAWMAIGIALTLVERSESRERARYLRSNPPDKWVGPANTLHSRDLVGDRGESAYILRGACERGSAMACDIFLQRLEDGEYSRGGVASLSPESTVELHSRACQLGITRWCPAEKGPDRSH